MQKQRERDTTPELEVRRALHGLGLRYRLHQRLIAGSRREVDIVFRSARIAVFIDGCFWHGCPEHGTSPRNNAGFWRVKLETNLTRDRDTTSRLEQAGWLVLRFWEHTPPQQVAAEVARAVACRVR